MFTILSAFDDRAGPKGLRDPLGAEACWSHLGRTLVGNLTTITSNLDNLMLALLCCRYAHQEKAAYIEAVGHRGSQAKPRLDGAPDLVVVAVDGMDALTLWNSFKGSLGGGADSFKPLLQACRLQSFSVPNFAEVEAGL